MHSDERHYLAVRVQVGWGDCDPAGIVFYPRFYAWMDTVSHVLAREMGIPREAMIPPGTEMLGFPVVGTQAQYLSPARMDDLLEVRTWVSRVGRSSLSLRHEILRVRRLLGPTREALHKVVDKRVDVEGVEALPHEVEIAFGDAYDKLLRAVDWLDLARYLLAGARDYHQAKIANDQNEVMKRLTAVASILLVPTFIVGLYGQNFRNIPELHWGWGYYYSLGLIAATTVAQLLYFRRRGWI